MQNKYLSAAVTDNAALELPLLIHLFYLLCQVTRKGNHFQAILSVSGVLGKPKGKKATADGRRREDHGSLAMPRALCLYVQVRSHTSL